jgi:hypothetical protein
VLVILKILQVFFNFEKLSSHIGILTPITEKKIFIMIEIASSHENEAGGEQIIADGYP